MQVVAAEARAEVVVVEQEVAAGLAMDLAVAAVLAVAAALEADQAVVADTLPTPIFPLQSLD